MRFIRLLFPVEVFKSFETYYKFSVKFLLILEGTSTSVSNTRKLTILLLCHTKILILSLMQLVSCE